MLNPFLLAAGGMEIVDHSSIVLAQESEDGRRGGWSESLGIQKELSCVSGCMGHFGTVAMSRSRPGDTGHPTSLRFQWRSAELRRLSRLCPFSAKQAASQSPTRASDAALRLLN